MKAEIVQKLDVSLIQNSTPPSIKRNFDIAHDYISPHALVVDVNREFQSYAEILFVSSRYYQEHYKKLDEKGRICRSRERQFKRIFKSFDKAIDQLLEEIEI